MDISFYVYDSKGVLVLASIDDYFIDKQKIKRKGDFRSTCMIPQDLLNDGQYFIQAGFTGKGIIHIIEKSVVSFIVSDYKDPMGARGLYHDSEWPPAAVRPKLYWKTEQYST